MYNPYICICHVSSIMYPDDANLGSLGYFKFLLSVRLVAKNSVKIYGTYVLGSSNTCFES